MVHHESVAGLFGLIVPSGLKRMMKTIISSRLLFFFCDIADPSLVILWSRSRPMARALASLTSLCFICHHPSLKLSRFVCKLVSWTCGFVLDPLFRFVGHLSYYSTCALSFVPLFLTSPHSFGDCSNPANQKIDTTEKQNRQTGDLCALPSFFFHGILLSKTEVHESLYHFWILE